MGHFHDLEDLEEFRLTRSSDHNLDLDWLARVYRGWIPEEVEKEVLPD
jgi:hypothetical protein